MSNVADTSSNASVSPAEAPLVPAQSQSGRFRRNASAVDVLSSTFSIVRRLSGDEFFRELAFQLSRQESDSPERWTATFPAFIAHYEPARAAPYLSDLARLELACARARQAADVVPLLRMRLGDTPDFFERTQVRLHPSVSLVKSRHPIVSIWEANRDPRRAVPVQHWGPETALVARPRNAVEVTRVPEGGGAFITALARGLTIADSIAAARAATKARFDTAANLQLVWDAGVVISHDPAEAAAVAPL